MHCSFQVGCGLVEVEVGLITRDLLLLPSCPPTPATHWQLNVAQPPEMQDFLLQKGIIIVLGSFFHLLLAPSGALIAIPTYY